MSLTLTLARSGLGLVLTTPSGHAVKVPLNSDKDRVNFTRLVEHILAEQALLAKASKPDLIASPASPIQYIIDNWLRGAGKKVHRLQPRGRGATFDAALMLEDLGLSAGSSDQ